MLFTGYEYPKIDFCNPTKGVAKKKVTQARKSLSPSLNEVESTQRSSPSKRTMRAKRGQSSTEQTSRADH